MPDTTRGYDWEGRTLKDRNGDKIGKIDALYVDQETDKPEWALVNTGLFGTKSSFVPLAGASERTMTSPRRWMPTRSRTRRR